MENEGKDPVPPSSPAEPIVPPRKPGSANVKWYAIIAVLIVIIAAFGVLAFYHPVSTGSSAQVVSASEIAEIGSSYNLSIKTNGAFSSTTVYWGDGQTTTVSYTGSQTLELSHVYQNPGHYYIYYVVNFGSGTFSNVKSLIPVSTSYGTVNQYQSVGLLNLLGANSSVPEVNNSYIFTPGSNLNFLVGYATSPSNSSYQVVSQEVFTYVNATEIGAEAFPYFWNATAGIYTLTNTDSYLAFHSMNTGYYTIELNTYTMQVESNGTANVSAGVYSTQYFIDIPVFSGASEYVAPVSGQVFTNAELVPGGFTTLDPAIGYGITGYEVRTNIMMGLTVYNGSSSTQSLPGLAAYLPTIANGGINNNTKTYNVTDPWGTTYKVKILPYENYTFHIRNNATFQNGQPVTAWDVMYSLVRTILFNSGEPGTPGWIQSQYLLPGNYYDTNTFWNITQNITVDNATNNITFHFQEPMEPYLVFETMGDEVSGSLVTSASWLESHGAGITWNASGFEAYKAEGSAGSYNTYVQTHAISDGPYEIDYYVPSSYVVLKANPDYNPPGKWFPKPTIGTVIIDYISEPSTVYLELSSKAAQAGGIPTSSWYEAQSLQSKGIDNIYSFPTLTIHLSPFNANVNMTILKTIDSSANMPSNLFTSLQVRKAFAYSYNYNYFLDEQLGNTVYHTIFGIPFAGVLDQGMLDNESIAQLNATTNGAVPYFNMALAKQNWDAFVNETNGGRAVSIYYDASTGMDVYNGAPLVIPVFVPSGDPVDVAGVTTWGDNLAQIIPGATFPVIQEEAVVMGGYQAMNENPMPFYQGFVWSPDYPYPTDYMAPMALPTNDSFFLGANGLTSYWFNSTSNTLRNSSEVSVMNSMIQDYNIASLSTNASIVKEYFQKENADLVNMTFFVYTYQQEEQLVISSIIPASNVINSEENVAVNGPGDLLYNFL